MKHKLLSNVFCLAAFSICNSGMAATFTVNNTEDHDDGACNDDDCTLREAILFANSEGGPNNIKITAAGTIKLASPLPTIAGLPSLKLVIIGPGADALTVEGDESHGIFNVIDTATIRGMTITKGGNGAISNEGHLSLKDCVITGNTGRTSGGAIINFGTLDVLNCTISRNVVSGQAGVQNGAAEGGAIFNGSAGTVTVRNSTLTANAAFGARPPIRTAGGHASGGAIKNQPPGTVRITNSTVSGNVARGGDTGVFLTATALNFTLGSGAKAEAYYFIVDPLVFDPADPSKGFFQQRQTLGDWWRVNGFDPENGDPVVFDERGHMAYFNNNDLGFGRDTTILRNGANVASWLANYSLTPPYPDQNPLSADAASAREPGRGIAAVCMEYSPIEIAKGVPFGKPIVKFFVYGGVGSQAKLQVSADLDGYGQKFVPYLCTACHGGLLGGDPTDLKVRNMNSFFREFDLASFKFARPGFPIDNPIRSSPDTPEEREFHKMNNLVLATNPSPAIKELINGWYGGDPPTRDFQDPNFVPKGWQRHPSDHQLDGEVKKLYQQVIATSCRTCHIAGKPGFAHPLLPDLNTFKAFKDYAPIVPLNVFVYHNKLGFGLGESTMPHSMIAFKNFWKSENPHRPIVLATQLAKLKLLDPSTPSFDGQGAFGGPAQGGGIDNQNGRVAITASTVAFNTAGGGVGFSATGQANGELDVSSSIAMGDAGGVFSEVSLPSTQSTTLHSSIIAENFGDTDHFVDTIALRRDDILGTFRSEDFNLIGASHESLISGPATHNKMDVANPGLGLLRNNGGPTFTHAISGSSPAFNAGDNRIVDFVTTDQRGFGRKIFDFVDIGAFEFGGTERDVTSQTGITRGGFYFNRATQRYEQQVIIQNIGNTSINRPLRLALDGVTVALHNEDGTDFQFGGIPFVTINTGNDGIFSEMERVSITLEFTNPLGTAIMYRPRVLETMVVP